MQFHFSYLLIDTYTVTENTDWSYKYTVDSATKSVTLTAAGGQVTFTNTAKTDKWLTDEAYAENSFNGYGSSNAVMVITGKAYLKRDDGTLEEINQEGDR